MFFHRRVKTMNENLENKSKMVSLWGKCSLQDKIFFWLQFSNNPANTQSELFFSEKKPKNRSSLAVSDDTMSFSSFSSFSSISTTNRPECDREMDGEGVEGEEVDLSGLLESVVDDDDSDEEDLAESMEVGGFYFGYQESLYVGFSLHLLRIWIICAS